jgi:hypothetical protein
MVNLHFGSKKPQSILLFLTSVMLVVSSLTGCDPPTEDLEVIDYSILPGGDWKVSTPEE